MIIHNSFLNVSVDEAFAKNTDGENCPIAKCYLPGDFINICNQGGFNTQFLGGYLSLTEMKCLKKFVNKAINDQRLDDQHKQFLLALEYNQNDYPKYQNKYAGIGGVYKLIKQ